MDILNLALSYDPDNYEIKTLLAEIQKEYGEDSFLPENHPEILRTNSMIQWMHQGGSKFDKIKLRYYAADYRGVHASKNISRGESIIFVPRHQIITLETAKTSPIGKKLVTKGLMKRLFSPKHSLLATYVMEEKRKSDSYWHSYLDLLPKSFGCFPVFYTPEEKQLLIGSPFLAQIEEKIQEIKWDYDFLC